MEEELQTNISYSTKSNEYLILKRVIDCFGALFGIMLLFPLLIVTAIVIKLSSKGSIFFTQERVGINEKRFKMYKFRSLVTNAEKLKEELMTENEMSGPMFKIRKDPRITKVGRVIRKTSIDELPQLFNVFKGDMSLVGPRPNLPKEVEKFNPYHKQKLLVKPGLTCYWQVMGRSSIGFEEWMELDIKYICERNTWIDIKLIIKTFFVLFGDKNAG